MEDKDNIIKATAICEDDVAEKMADELIDDLEMDGKKIVDVLHNGELAKEMLETMANGDDDEVTSCSITIVDVPEVKVTTINEMIDNYFDEKRMLIVDKIGDVVDDVVGEDEGSAARMYLMSGEMLRSVLALMCYEASGGDSDDADDIAAIIEIASSMGTFDDDMLNHDYAKDIDDGIKNVLGTPGAILRGDFGFVGNIFGAIRDGPKMVIDGVNAAKIAVGSTVAEVSRGDFASDSPYVTMAKANTALALSIACRIGSEKAGSEECVELCGIFGRNAGVAYKVARDMCVLERCIADGEPSKNILDGELNLCMMYALDRCGTNAIVNTDDAKWLFKELSKEDAFDDGILRLQMIIRKYNRNAVKAAERLPSGIHRDMLVAIPDYLQDELVRGD